VSPRTAEVVIVGAGVMGASIAFQLARRGAGRVVVLDKGDVASGGSGRSSALVRMHYSFAPEVQLALSSLGMFRAWPELIGYPSHFRKTGFIRLVPEHEVDRLRRNVEMQRALGVNAQVLDRAELQEVAPLWDFSDVSAAAFEPDSGYGDGAGVATDFLTRARESGVEYRPGTRVEGLRVEGGRVRGVAVPDGVIEAPVVVVATGPWCRPLLAATGFDAPIESEFHEVVLLKNPAGVASIGPTGIDSPTETYYRSEAGGLTLIGDFYGKRGVDPDAFPQAASQEGMLRLVERTARRIPVLAEAGFFRGVTGCYDMSPDARPLLGPVPGIDGLHLVAGFSGMGFKISPAVGVVMAELLCDGRATTVDITPFRPGRFQEGQPIRAPYEYASD
jgi:glycine/D-amino acid oxidase-like deaminating enzyme